MDSAQSTPSVRHRYDVETRQVLQRAFRDGWKLLKERQPSQSWESYNDLKHALSERLMMLADEGVTNFEEMLRRALEGLLPTGARKSPRQSSMKDGVTKARRFKSAARTTPKSTAPGRFRERHLP